MKSETYILVDLLPEISKYIILDKSKKYGYQLIAKGKIKRLQELANIEQNYKNTKVYIGAPEDRELDSVAKLYKWNLVKTTPGDLPFIEALIQLAN